MDNTANVVSPSRTTRVQRTAIALAILAVVFYVGIILTMVWR